MAATAYIDLLARAEAAEVENTALRKMQPVQLNESGTRALELAAEVSELKQKLAAAEERAKKAERERDAYKEMICKERPCAFCAGYTGEWNPECIRCDRCTKEYRPKFRLKEKKEE